MGWAQRVLQVSSHPMGSRRPMQRGNIWVGAVCGVEAAGGRGLADPCPTSRRRCRRRLVEALLERGADPNLVLPEGVTAVHLAASKEREGGVRCLGLILHHGGDPNARAAEGLTPLHVAASWGCSRGLELLLKEGGDPELRDQEGKRAIDLALEQGNRACVQVLRDWHHGACRWPPDAPTDLRRPRRSLSFLTEDRTEGSVCSRLSEDGSELGPPSGTRLGEPEAGLAHGCAPRPLACSTLLHAGGSPGGGSSEDEPFVSAAETLEPPEAGGSPGAAALPALLQACSLGGSSPPGPEPPRLHHVTPRTKSRLEASAARLGTASAASSSSSLFSATLEMPQRPPRHRAPAAPPGQRGTLEDGDTSDPDPEDTGSLDATVLLPGTSVGSGAAEPPQPLSDTVLLRELRRLGADPGPVTALTRPVYAQRLAALSAEAAGSPTGHSPELAAALETCRIPDCADEELALARQFGRPDGGRRWRGGTCKSSFNYLLLDPRATRDLPLRSPRLSPAERFRTFVRAIFYVGKGTRARPYRHLCEALSRSRAGPTEACPKVRRILEIWASGLGVISVHCFQSAVPAEAYTREACLVEAIGLRMLTNQKKGNCYGVAASWSPRRRRRLGVHMLHRAMQIFLAEGERQLRPADVPAGR
ncbi:ankyrin repeat and LEM domain-containing protein 1 [Rhea pennata]|uniref:ankyrin repeat and LEM domain-containing protein 1 n=1 Tax=Rhea pennata TaxID=8795 RepID=UPI002E26351F